MLIKNNNRPELVPGEILRPNVTIFTLRPYGTVVDAMRICDRQKQQWFFLARQLSDAKPEGDIT